MRKEKIKYNRMQE